MLTLLSPYADVGVKSRHSLDWVGRNNAGKQRRETRRRNNEREKHGYISRALQKRHRHLDLDRLFRARYGLSLRRVGGQCAGFAQPTVKRRHDHTSGWDVYLDNRRKLYQGD